MNESDPDTTRAAIDERASSSDGDPPTTDADNADIAGLARLFVQAQKAIDDVLARANREAAEIVSAAHATADRIASEGREKAEASR